MRNARTRHKKSVEIVFFRLLATPIVSLSLPSLSFPLSFSFDFIFLFSLIAAATLNLTANRTAYTMKRQRFIVIQFSFLAASSPAAVASSLPFDSHSLRRLLCRCYFILYIFRYSFRCRLFFSRAQNVWRVRNNNTKSEGVVLFNAGGLPPAVPECR